MNIYIYLSEPTKQKLKEIQQRYKISLSTMAQILSDYFRPNIKKYPNEYLTKYIDTEHRNKTTIKPNNTKETSEFFNIIKNETSTASHLISNLLFLYANEKYIELLLTNDDKIINKTKKEINNEFYNAVDDLWDYNEWIRRQIRRETKGKNVLNKYRSITT